MAKHPEHMAGQVTTGRPVVVDTSFERGDGSVQRTHARVELKAISVGGLGYRSQEITATFVGASRAQALMLLENELMAMLSEVRREREAAESRPYVSACLCHSCCPMSCCNPPIEAAWQRNGGS